MRIVKTFHDGNMQLPWLFWRTCIRVVKAGGILVPDPATVHCGQHYDRKAGSRQQCKQGIGQLLHACILITWRMHANSDMVV